VIVENVAGSLRVAKAAPDFHQIVLGNSGTHAQNQSLYMRPPYNPATDFAPVALIGSAAMVLIVRNELPAHHLDMRANWPIKREPQARQSRGRAESTLLRGQTCEH
jgi:tripartite-type tricarboxylate transporter receptor subunit TctC